MSQKRPAAAWKIALRRTPGGAAAVKVIVFVAGLVCVLLGVAALPLPGPWTIPPFLVGFYIWSTEFAWAERLLERAKRSAQEAWENAKRRPVITTIVTLGGLIAFGVGVYLVGRYDLVDRAKELLGLG